MARFVKVLIVVGALAVGWGCLDGLALARRLGATLSVGVAGVAWFYRKDPARVEPDPE